MSDRQARGRVITQKTTMAESTARSQARLWSLARSALRMIDGMELRAKGLYEINPVLVLKLRESVDGIRHQIKRHDETLRSISDDE